MTHVIRWGVLAGMLLLIGAGPADDADKSAPQTQDQLVAALLARNRDLERKNAELQRQVQQLQARLVMIANPRSVPDRDGIPDDWKRRQFNGITYYLVPLETVNLVPTTRPSR